MIHSLKINETEVKADFGCYHPEMVNNTCPEDGDCANCRHCKAVIEDVSALLDAAAAGKGEK